MRKLLLVTITCPPLEEALNFLTLPPKSHVQSTCVNSCPSTYTHIGLGSMAKITSQQAAPPPTATHTGLPGEPLWRKTMMSALTAPRQSGSSNRAMMVLNHFGMGEV